MGFVTCLRGIGSGVEYPPDTVMNLCPQDGRPVEMVFDLERLQAQRPNMTWYHPERKDMWRFGGLLPLDIDDENDRPHILSLGEGYTPHLDYDDFPLAKRVGFRLRIKDEGMPHQGYGSNPTLAFKDRGMAMVVSMARKLGIDKLAIPTQGNAGDSLVHYCVAAGLQIAVAMPDATPLPILGKVAAAEKINDGVHLELVQGTIVEAGERIKSYLSRGFFNAATFQEPGWRIEGKKTMGLELAEPRLDKPHWGLPDVIVYPTGGGMGLVAMWKAFGELEALGLIGPKRPRIISVQSEGTQPLVKAMADGASDTTKEAAGVTLAPGINVPCGVGHFKVLSILRESKGGAVAVSERSIANQLRDTWQQKGWWFTPEGIACIAGLESLVEQGFINSGDEVAVINTGSFEKYLPNIRRLLC